jgi:hypothetical protein
MAVDDLEDIALWRLDEVSSEELGTIEDLAYGNDEYYDVGRNPPIEEQGILNPIELRWGKEKPYISNGNHRLAVARLLGIEKVPVRISPQAYGDEVFLLQEWLTSRIRKHATHDQSTHGNWAHGRNLFPFEDATGIFHYAASDSSKAKRGREPTLCGLSTESMRRGSNFPTGDPRGAVHLERGCDDCIDIISEAEFDKHMGPGPHPSGTPQAVHGGRTFQAPGIQDYYAATDDADRYSYSVREQIPHDYEYSIVKNYSGTGIHASRSNQLGEIREKGGLDPLISEGGYFGRGIYSSFGPSGEALQWHVLDSRPRFTVEYHFDKVLYMEVDDWGEFSHYGVSAAVKDALLRELPGAESRINGLLDSEEAGWSGGVTKAYDLLQEAGFDALVWSRGTDLDYGGEWGSQVVAMTPGSVKITGFYEEKDREAVRDPDEFLAAVTKADVSMVNVIMWADMVDWVEGRIVKTYSPYAKHMGPGPHPSGSSQDVHGQQGRLFYPTGDDDRSDNSDDRSPVNITFVDDSIGNWRENDAEVIKRAVTEFSERYPGALPKDLTFTLVDADANATAYVFPDISDEVNVNNMSEWGETDEDVGELALSNTEDGTWKFSYARTIEALGHARELGGNVSMAEIGHAYKQGVIFHELGHIAAANRDWGANYPDNWPFDRYPYYSQDWYPTQVTVSDPSLPSAYATGNAAEYFAEALTDWHYNEDLAADYSKLTAKLFYEDLQEGES